MAPPLTFTLAAIKAKLFFDGEILSGESFVDFDQVNVVEGQSRFLQGDLRSWNRATAHEFRFDARDPPAYDAAHRFDATFRGLFERHDHDRALRHPRCHWRCRR